MVNDITQHMPFGMWLGEPTGRRHFSSYKAVSTLPPPPQIAELASLSIGACKSSTCVSLLASFFIVFDIV